MKFTKKRSEMSVKSFLTPSDKTKVRLCLGAAAQVAALAQFPSHGLSGWKDRRPDGRFPQPALSASSKPQGGFPDLQKAPLWGLMTPAWA